MTATEIAGLKKSSSVLGRGLADLKVQSTAVPEKLISEPTPQKSLSELKVEIKFHLGQMAGHAVEIGRLLIQAKEQVGHGEWQNWLEENFNLKKSSAANFMNIAQRFGGNFQSIGNLNYTQMVQLLALPEGEEENFIAEKAAEGTPVEEMTIKNLRAEIKDYKEKLAQVTAEKDSADSELKKVTQDRDSYKTSAEIAENQLENFVEGVRKFSNALEVDSEQVSKVISDLSIDEKSAELEENIADLKRQMGTVTTVADPTLNAEELQDAYNEIEQLQEKLADKESELRELQDRPIEVAVETPADYEATKAELAELKEKQKNLQENYSVTKRITEMFTAAEILLNCVRLQEIIAEMAERDSAGVGDKIFKLTSAVGEVENYFKMWTRKK